MLGKTPTDDHRDCVHVAIVPMTSKYKVSPGQHVDAKGNPREQQDFDAGKPVGIVDPFLDFPIPAGESFYVMVYPETITSMRHHWQHPDFDAVQEDTVSSDESPDYKKYLEECATIMNITYEQLLSDAIEFGQTGEYTLMNTQEYGYITDWPFYWEAVISVTRKTFLNLNYTNSPYTCPC